MNIGMYYKFILQTFPVFRFSNHECGHKDTVPFIYDEIKTKLLVRLQKISAIRRLIAVGAWPLMAFFSILHMLALNGRTVKARSGKSLFEQLKANLDLSFRHGIFPHYYYMYEIYLDDNYDRVFDYLTRPAIKPFGVYQLVYSENSSFVRQPALADKRLFSDMCTRNGFPTAEVYAEFTDGEALWADPELPALPERNIFVKPRKGKGGRGAELWTFADGVYTNSRGVRADAQSLADRLKRLSGKKTSPLGRSDHGNAETWLAVEHFTNHSDLLDLSTGAFNTLRIVTCRNMSWEVEHIVTIFRMARDRKKVVDNCHAGGLAALVHPASGVLGQATDDGISARLGWLDRHPVTGAKIEGRKIPFWEEALDLACRAHESLGPVPFVGWDIGILESGPCLIEGNSAPCIEIEQRVGGPQGNARFGELLAGHIRNEGTFEITQTAAE